MNKRQQKHDMMLSFLCHAKTAKKHKAKQPALINITIWGSNFINTIQKMLFTTKQKLLSNYLDMVHFVVKAFSAVF
jgi:hypothetical protein